MDHSVAFVPNENVGNAAEPAEADGETQQPDAQPEGSGPGERESNKITQANVGATLPVECWNTASTAVTWVVKWCINGLTPVRPVVTILSEATLPDGHALDMSV